MEKTDLCVNSGVHMENIVSSMNNVDLAKKVMLEIKLREFLAYRGKMRAFKSYFIYLYRLMVESCSRDCGDACLNSVL
jgi:hypothetical protein